MQHQRWQARVRGAQLPQRSRALSHHRCHTICAHCRAAPASQPLWYSQRHRAPREPSASETASSTAARRLPHASRARTTQPVGAGRSGRRGRTTTPSGRARATSSWWRYSVVKPTTRLLTGGTSAVEICLEPVSVSNRVDGVKLTPSMRTLLFAQGILLHGKRRHGPI